jgi:hypothetical protein
MQLPVNAVAVILRAVHLWSSPFVVSFCFHHPSVDLSPVLHHLPPVLYLIRFRASCGLFVSFGDLIVAREGSELDGLHHERTIALSALRRFAATPIEELNSGDSDK